jgi:hypothetical protein
VIEFLRRDGRQSDIPVLYYYFNFRDKATQTCENFVRTIMYQLVQELPDVPQPLIDLYSYCRQSDRPSTTDLTQCLIDVINTLVEVRLLGDAFDECVEWNKLSTFLCTVIKSNCPALRFLFTSRPEQHIQDLLKSLAIPSIGLLCPEMNVDIRTFISQTLEQDDQFKQISLQSKDLIRENLVNHTNGMYVCCTSVSTFTSS